ncbi:MAG TPA: LEA type 2 family protein, partial [Candidatus Manganitrophaceae bacterium]
MSPAVRSFDKILVLFVLFSLASCASMKVVSRPEWRLQGVRIDHISLSKVTLGIDARITNPNFFSVTIRQARYRFYLGEILIAQGEKTEPFDLPGHGVADVLLPAEISLAAAREIAPLLKSDPGGGGANWRLEGEFALKVFGVENIFPFKKEGGDGKGHASAGGELSG